MEIQVIRFSFSVSDIIKKTFWHRKVRRIFADSKKSRTFASLSKTKPSYKEVWKGGRVVDYSGLENRRASARKVKRFCKTFCRTFFVDNHSNDFRKPSRRKTK